MSNQDWLSLSEIARLWSDETGESADALERDLEDWFAAFVERPASQQSGSPGGAGDTTNVLMGLLGSRHLQRETFEIYCQEKGLDKPLFWFSDDNDDMEDEEPQAPPSWDWPGYDARQGPVGNAPESGPAASEPAAIPEPDGNDEPWLERDALWQAAREAPPIAPARPGRMPLTMSRLGRLKSGRLAGGLAFGLALMVAGYLLGQDGGGPSPTGPEAAATDPVPTAVESTLRSELVEARRQIDSLGAALEASDTEIRQLTKNLLTARQAPDTAKRTTPLDAAPPSPRPGASDVSSDREISALKTDLAAARQTIARLRETAAASQTGAVKQSLIQAATSASAQAMSFKASLDGAHQRIAELVREAQTARAEADALAAELDKVRRQQETPPRGIAAAAETSRQRLILATEIARTQAALSKQELAAALTRLVRLESEAETAKAEAARLTGELAETRRLRAAELDASAVEREGARRVPVLAAQAVSVHAAKLDRDLHAALRRIAELEAQAGAAEAEAVGLAGQLDAVRTNNSANLERLLAEAASRQEALDDARQRIARLEAAQPPPDTQAEGPADESQEAARPEPSAPPESIDVDSLVAEPGRYDARRVVVTGFLMRLLQHYRLQSESGVRTLVVDVGRLHRDQYELLQQAIADAGLIGSVRAQISGKVERGSETAFRLVASDVRLIE